MYYIIVTVYYINSQKHNFKRLYKMIGYESQMDYNFVSLMLFVRLPHSKRETRNLRGTKYYIFTK